MWFLLVFISMVIAQDYNTNDDILFEGQYYDREILFDGYGKSYHLMLHVPTNDLFISRASRSDDFNDREIMACQVLTKTCRYITGILGGYITAYDNQNDTIYFGTKNGIYYYDFVTRKANPLAVIGEAIWGIFVIGKYFYYIVFPALKLYVVENNDFNNAKVVIDTEIDNFFVSKNETVYFSNSTGLYKVERPAVPNKAPIAINRHIHVRQITQDAYGNVYFCAYEGIYVDDESKRQLRKISNIDKPFGMAYMNVISKLRSNGLMAGTIIYSDSESIYRLVERERHDSSLSMVTSNSRTRIKRRRKKNSRKSGLLSFITSFFN